MAKSDDEEVVTATTAPPPKKLVVAANVFPPHLPLIPLPSRPLFPKTVAPLVVS